MFKMVRKKFFITIFLAFLCLVTGKKSTRNEEVENHKNLKVSVTARSVTLDPVSTLSPCILQATWSCTVCTDLDHYRVTWTEVDSGDSDYEDVKKVTSYEIDQLNSNQTYSIYVTLYSTDGTSINSNTETAVTEVGDPQSVTGFTVDDQTDSKIMVSWRNSTNPCPIKGFHLIWNGDAKWDEHRHAGGEYTTAGKSKISYTIANLMPYSDYDIRIHEVTTDLIQGSNATQTATTDERQASSPLSVVANTLNSTSIYVSWKAPSSANGVITAYNVQWNIDDDEDTAGSANTTSEDELSYTITGLLACGDYSINVAAINGGGIGSSDPVSNTTDEAKPPAPDNLECVYGPLLNPDHITVTWDLVNTSATRCIIDHYEVKYRSEVLWNGNIYSTSDTTDNTTTNYTIDSLSPYTSYGIQVCASTSKYTGNISSCPNIVTNEQAPGAPDSLEIVEGTLEDSSSFAVVWNDPIDKNGALKSYHVTLYNETDEILEEVDIDYIDFTDAFYAYQFSDLATTDNYSVEVYAVNGFGEGSKTDLQFSFLEEYEMEYL